MKLLKKSLLNKFLTRRIEFLQFKDEEVQVFFAFINEETMGRGNRKVNGADIFLYVNNFCDKGLDKYFPFSFIDKISYFFLIEFLCHCIMRGNRMKKNCIHRKSNRGKKKGEYKSYDCIPKLVSDKVMKFLGRIDFCL